MSRYIDTKWLEDNAKEYSLGYYESDEWATPLNVLDSAPSIDIVRCRECKWFDSGKNDSEIWSMCTRHFGKYIDVNADDFCSYGERSEKPNNCEDEQMETQTETQNSNSSFEKQTDCAWK